MNSIYSEEDLVKLAQLHLPGYGFAKTADSGASAVTAAAAPPPIVCASTRRIVLISPYPNLLHELIRDLSAACYDVMVFHRADDYVLHSLQADLYLIDGSAADMLGSDPGFRTFTSDPSKLSRAVLLDDRHKEGKAFRTGFDSEGMPTVAPAAALEFVQDWLLRHPAADEADPGILGFKDLILDTKRMAVFRGGSPIDLTKTEYELLLSFIGAEGAVQTRDHLMATIWDAPFFGNSNVVDVHVKSLRRKLGDNALAPMYIETVRGVGYRLAD
ncbi:winged-helix domain-containing protein [Paenibacillus sp. P22]|uniref:winged helix-turn-helix domain-containing protein n=1 Tax=Paenibacillus sp. P22 TaxID=483908 RepID=UPI00040A15CA|nr:winged-helix domain-containing protein [Paenibacillus sp. P22]CDN45462.1 Transcriptional regulator domain-containing protein [Paenibacillus sp. P22]